MTSERASRLKSSRNRGADSRVDPPRGLIESQPLRFRGVKLHFYDKRVSHVVTTLFKQCDQRRPLGGAAWLGKNRSRAQYFSTQYRK